MQLADLHEDLDPRIAKEVVREVEWAIKLLDGPIDYDDINDAIETLERARWRLTKDEVDSQ